MSIDYSKGTEEKPHTRYFVGLPVLGWYEVDEKTYIDINRTAVPRSVWSSEGVNDGFSGSGVEGYKVNGRNGRKLPESFKTMMAVDAEDSKSENPAVPPRVERQGTTPEAPVRLVFPDGSYTDMDEDGTSVTIILSGAQYAALAKAQTPLSLETLAYKMSRRPVPDGSFRADLRDTLVEAIQGVAKDLRAGKVAESPLKGAAAKLRAVKDLLK